MRPQNCKVARRHYISSSFFTFNIIFVMWFPIQISSNDETINCNKMVKKENQKRETFLKKTVYIAKKFECEGGGGGGGGGAFSYPSVLFAYKSSTYSTSLQCNLFLNNILRWKNLIRCIPCTYLMWEITVSLAFHQILFHIIRNRNWNLLILDSQ